MDNQLGHTCISIPSHDPISHMFKVLTAQLHFHSVFTENMLEHIHSKSSKVESKICGISWQRHMAYIQQPYAKIIYTLHAHIKTCFPSQLQCNRAWTQDRRRRLQLHDL